MNNPLERALIVREPWATMLLKGTKVWEMRSRPTKIRGRIGIIAAKSGFVMGEVSLVDSLSAQSRLQMLKSMAEHRIASMDEVDRACDLGWVYPWVMVKPVLYPMPCPYKHPSGAVIWVNLAPQKGLDHE